MSHPFEEVVIIYNPNSTGRGKENAFKLRDDLQETGYEVPVKMYATEHAGHAETIAQEYAKSTKNILLISSSGDGGYHEMINGILSSSATNITAGLIPSGNANDHYRTLFDDKRDLAEAIIAGKRRSIDTIKVSSTIDGAPWSRYAHSYAGIGLTPAVGQELTKTDLNLLNEKWLVIKYLFKYTHATIRVNGKKKRYSSLIFSNINRMSKVLKLSESSSVEDGKFEISSIKYRSKLHTLLLLVKSATFGLEELGSYNSFDFQTTKRLLIQLDGEVYRLDKKSGVSVECTPSQLKTIL